MYACAPSVWVYLSALFHSWATDAPLFVLRSKRTSPECPLEKCHARCCTKRWICCANKSSGPWQTLCTACQNKSKPCWLRAKVKGYFAPGNLPPLFTHSSTEAKGVNFLVLPYEGEPFSWQMPESDFFTTGSAAKAILPTKARAAKDKKLFWFNMDNLPNS